MEKKFAKMIDSKLCEIEKKTNSLEWPQLKN